MSNKDNDIMVISNTVKENINEDSLATSTTDNIKIQQNKVFENETNGSLNNHNTTINKNEESNNDNKSNSNTNEDVNNKNKNNEEEEEEEKENSLRAEPMFNLTLFEAIKYNSLIAPIFFFIATLFQAIFLHYKRNKLNEIIYWCDIIVNICIIIYLIYFYIHNVKNYKNDIEKLKPFKSIFQKLIFIKTVIFILVLIQLKQFRIFFILFALVKFKEFDVISEIYELFNLEFLILLIIFISFYLYFIVIRSFIRQIEDEMTNNESRKRRKEKKWTKIIFREFKPFFNLNLNQTLRVLYVAGIILFISLILLRLFLKDKIEKDLGVWYHIDIYINIVNILFHVLLFIFTSKIAFTGK